MIIYGRPNATKLRSPTILLILPYQGLRRKLIGDQCAIVYTDFASDVGPILCALRSLGIGEMDAEERQEAQDEWMQGNVQVMVAGDGSNKSVRIRNL